MRICTSGSVGALGGKPPRATGFWQSRKRRRTLLLIFHQRPDEGTGVGHVRNYSHQPAVDAEVVAFHARFDQQGFPESLGMPSVPVRESAGVLVTKYRLCRRQP